MAKAREHRTAWIIAAGVAALAVVVGIVVGVTASPSATNSSVEISTGAASGEGASAPDASTIGQDTDTDAATQEQEIMEFVPNEVLVDVEDPAVLETLVPGAQLANGTIVAVERVTQDDDGTGVVKITFEGDATEDDVLDALNTMGGVSAQKNFVYHLM